MRSPRVPVRSSRRPSASARGSLSLLLLALAIASPTSGASPSPSDRGPDTASVWMPAGTQFDDRSWTEVKPEAGTGALSAEHDGVEVTLGVRVRRGLAVTVATVHAGDAAPETSTVDDGRRWRAPKGYPTRRGVAPTALAAGPHGFLATGVQHFWDGELAHQGTLEGVIWHSTDGRRWERFDPRTILGQRVSLRPASIAVDGRGRYFVLLDMGGLGMRGVSRLVVLRSEDGRRWTRTATLRTRWALGGRSIVPTSDGLQVHAVEYICDGTSGAMYSFSVAAQPRIWSGDADGTGWARVRADGGGLLVSPREPPDAASDCPRDLAAREKRYRPTGSLVPLPSGRAVAIDGAVGRAAVDPGTGRWTVGDLPGAALADGADRDIRATTAIEEPDGSVVVLSLERRRRDGVSAYPGMQVVAWRTSDLGATWQLLPATRPILLSGTGQRLEPRADGSVVLIEQVCEAGAQRTVQVGSVAGPLIAWETCRPSAGADCRFATLADIDVAGADLAGIDLTGATVTGGDWSGVGLRGARLRSATLEVSLAGADLADADATSATLGDITGASLRGTILRWASIPFAALGAEAREADLRGAYVSVPPQVPPGIDVTGLDLSGVWFAGSSDAAGDLTERDFGKAVLEGASFSDVDLTGASLGKARWTSLTFYDGTICPDGRPAKRDVYDATACRLRQR